MNTKKIKFGLFYVGTGKLVKFYTDESVHSDEKSVALMLVKRILKEEGKDWNLAAVKQYLCEYAEWMKDEGFDVTDFAPENITDWVADHLVYSNAPHVIRLSNKTEVNSDFKREVMNEIVRLFDRALTHKAEVA